MNKRKGVLRIMLVGLVVLLALFASGPVLAAGTGATQGDMALNLASTLGLSLPANATGQDAINALSALGINPSAGWNANAPADGNFISSLYTAVQSAFNAGRISPAGGLTPSSVVASACTSSNISQSECVDAIQKGGGDSGAATQGATLGAKAAGGPVYYGPGFDGYRPGSGGGGGGVNPSPDK